MGQIAHAGKEGKRKTLAPLRNPKRRFPHFGVVLSDCLVRGNRRLVKGLRIDLPADVKRVHRMWSMGLHGHHAQMGACVCCVEAPPPPSRCSVCLQRVHSLCAERALPAAQSKIDSIRRPLAPDAFPTCFGRCALCSAAMDSSSSAAVELESLSSSPVAALSFVGLARRASGSDARQD